MGRRSAGGPPPPLPLRHGAGFEIRRLSIPPGGERTYDETEWSDAIVVVEQGSVELEMRGGRRGTFVRGDVLHIDALPVRLLRNPGRVPTVLAATSRSHRDR